MRGARIGEVGKAQEELHFLANCGIESEKIKPFMGEIPGHADPVGIAQVYTQHAETPEAAKFGARMSPPLNGIQHGFSLRQLGS